MIASPLLVALKLKGRGGDGRTLSLCHVAIREMRRGGYNVLVMVPAQFGLFETAVWLGEPSLICAG